ncbi:aldehyde dehydrogenase family protein, partial [Staphylococcus capitis]|uniref:aldehyde dehydrogenase family protein n=1 Tax=Staphylococcus capitis TaxID=29388 RepID=UPI0011A03130
PNLQQLVQPVHLPILFNQPDLSTPPSTFLLQSSIYHQLLPKLKQPFQNITLPHPFHQNLKISPQTPPHQLQKIQTYVKIPQHDHKP